MKVVVWMDRIECVTKSAQAIDRQSKTKSWPKLPSCRSPVPLPLKLGYLFWFVTCKMVFLLCYPSSIWLLCAIIYLIAPAEGGAYSIKLKPVDDSIICSSFVRVLGPIWLSYFGQNSCTLLRPGIACFKSWTGSLHLSVCLKALSLFIHSLVLFLAGYFQISKMAASSFPAGRRSSFGSRW